MFDKKRVHTAALPSLTIRNVQCGLSTSNWTDAGLEPFSALEALPFATFSLGRTGDLSSFTGLPLLLETETRTIFTAPHQRTEFN